jgi:predicted ArsR family transcriptional regulator
MRIVVAEEQNGPTWTDNALLTATVQIMVAARQNRSGVGGVSMSMIGDILGVNERTVELIVQDLLEKGCIEPLTNGQGAVGGQPSRMFVITEKGADYLTDRFSQG